MSKGVKFEFDHGSRGISQQTHENAAGVSNAGGDDVLPERGRPVNRFMENYDRDGLDSDPDLSKLFRGVGEKQYLWSILRRENPWGVSNNKQRNETWDRAAEKVMKPGIIEIPQEEGNRTVRVDVCKDTHISIGAMHLKIKRLWFSSKAAFLRGKQRAVAETGESIVPEGEWCGEGEVSEKLQLGKTIRLADASTATRHTKPTVSKEHALAAAAARDAAVQRMHSAGGRSAGRGKSRRGGRSGTRGGCGRQLEPAVRKEHALAGAAVRDESLQQMLSAGGRSADHGAHQYKPAFSKEHERAAAAKRDEIIERLASERGLGAGRDESGGGRSSVTRGGRDGRGGRGGGRVIPRGGRGDGGGERGDNARLPSLEEETESLEEEEEGEEEEEEEEEDTSGGSSSDEESVAEFRGERARALARGTLGRQVNHGAGGTKRKEAPVYFDESMDPSHIVGVVGKRIMDKMDNGDAGIGEVRRQVNQRLDLLAAEHKRALDKLEAQQNVMSGQLSALLEAFNRNAAAGAAPPPFAYSAPQPHAVHMASLPWLGVQAGVLSPYEPMGFAGVAGPGGGVAVGRQAGGAHLPGVGNAGAAVGFAGVERVAGQQQQQGGPAGSERGAAGLQGGEAPVPAFGNAGAAWGLQASEVWRDDCSRACPVGAAEEEQRVGEGEGAPSAPATTSGAFCGR